MENDKNDVKIDWIVFESTQARNERTNKRLSIALIVSIVLLFLSNVIWLYYWAQYDYTSSYIEYFQDSEGLNNINTGSQGDVLNEPKFKNKNENTETEER